MKKNLTPTRTRWAKERRGLVAPALPGGPTIAAVEAEARRYLNPPRPQDPAPTPREAHMLSYLMDAAGGSLEQRTRAVDKVRSWGWTDEQISAALAAETRRLEYTGYLLRNPPGFKSLRQVAAERLRETSYDPGGPPRLTAGEDLPEGTPLRIADEPPQECSCHGTNHDERLPRASWRPLDNVQDEKL